MPSLFDREFLRVALVGASMFVSVAQAAAPSVTYALQGSGSLWQYDLSFIGDAAFGATLEFEFDDALYSNVSVVSYGPEFSFVSALPSVTAGSPSLVDASFAQDVTAATPAHVLVSFTWLGAASQPASQNWFLSDIDLNPVASGVTTAASVVPEPATLFMAAAGLALLGSSSRRKRST